MVGLRWGYDPRPIQRAACPPWPDEQQTHPAALAIDSSKVAGWMEAKHDWTEELTTAETIFRRHGIRPGLEPKRPILIPRERKRRGSGRPDV